MKPSNHPTMKYLLPFLSLALLYQACTCDPEFVVNEESFGTTFFATEVITDCIIEREVPDAGLTTISREIIIKFNKPVDKASVEIESSILLSPQVINNFDTYYTSGQTEFHIPFCKSIVASFDSPFNCTDHPDQFTVTLVGESGGLTSLSGGQLLDGDNNGTDGGNGIFELPISQFCGPFQVDSIWHDTTQLPSQNFCTSTLHIIFNKPVSCDFFQIGSYVKIEPFGMPSAECVFPFEWQIFSFNEPFVSDGMVTFPNSGDFMLQSTEGQVLDGDRDGIDGGAGEYVTEIGCQ